MLTRSEVVSETCAADCGREVEPFVGQQLYRYERGFDWDESPRLIVLRISKVTDKGYWASRGSLWGKPHLILRSSTKKYAYTTKEAAFYSYVRRCERCVKILQYQYERAQNALAVARKQQAAQVSPTMVAEA